MAEQKQSLGVWIQQSREKNVIPDVEDFLGQKVCFRMTSDEI